MSENKEKKETKQKVKELEKFDFSSNENFDIDKYYETLNDYQVERENMKQQEAEEIIKNKGPQYLDKETIEELKSKKENLRNFIKRYDYDKEELKQLSNESGGGRDKIYKIANYLYNKFSQDINELKIYITFTWSEFDFIKKTLFRKIEYNSDEVFQLLRLRNDGGLDDYIKQFNNDKEKNDIQVVMKISHVVLLYHLLNKYKVQNAENKEFEKNYCQKNFMRMINMRR